MIDDLRCSISSGSSSPQNRSQGMAEAHDPTTADVADFPDRQPDLALDIQTLQILDSSDDCIKVLDLDGRILFMSQGGQVLLGIQDIAPFLNTSWIGFWQGADQQAAIEAIAKARTGGIFTFQGSCPTPSGKPKWWDVKISPIRGTEGQVERLLCISRDITERRHIEEERKQAEEKLRESEERYRAIINQAVTGVACTDLDGTLTLVNQKYCDITGYSADELQLRRMQDITHPEDLPRNIELFHRMRTEGIPFEIEKRYIRKDGSIVWVNNSVSVIRDRDGKPQSAVAIVLDITERKQIALSAEFLATVTQDLAEATCVEDIIHLIGEQLNQYFQASICAFVEINESAEVAAIHHSWHQQDAPSLVGVYHLAEFVTDEFFQMAKAGQTIIVRDITTDPQIADPERFTSLKISSFINVPLIRDNEWKFTLGIYHQTPYNWRSDEVELMRELANRVWTKLERNRVEVALRQSQEMFSTLVADAPFGVYIIDAEFRFRQANQTAIKAFNIQPLIGRDLAEALRIIWQEPFATEAINRFRHTLAIGESYYSPPIVELRVDITEIQSYDWQIHRITLPDGSYGVVCYFYDLSEIKRAEEIMRRNADRDAFLVSLNDALRPLTNASEIQATAARILGESLGATRVIYIEVASDGEEVIVHCNYVNGVAELSGRYRLEDYRRNLMTDHQAGRTQVVMDIPGDPGYTDAEKARYHEIDIAAHIDVPLIKNNHFVALLAAQQSTPRKWTEIEVSLVEETAERTWAAVERARTEEALRESEAKYRSLFESIDEGFCLIEVLFDETGKAFDHRFLEANPAFEKHTGLVNVVGKTVRELVPQTEAYWFEIYGRIALTGVPERFENAAQAIGRFYDVYAFRMGEPHEHKVAVLFNDINDRKQAEAQRKQLLEREQAARAEAEYANRIKDEFLAVLSHELRSPLNPILGWAKLLQNGKLDATKTAQALATIERNAKLQSELIEDLLDVSRILRGKLSLNVAPVNLAATIRGAMETVRLAAEAKSIDLRLMIADSELENEDNPKSKTQNPKLLVLGDSTRLQQVVWNLLSNAVKFTPEGGRVEVQLKTVGKPLLGGEENREDRGDKISSLPAPPSLPAPSFPSAQITVRDTGQGIGPDFLPYVFDYFRQADSATTRKFGGLGLGLAIVRHLVELHGGTVRADSLGEGQGATFTIQIPLMPTPLPAKPDDRSPQQSSNLNGIKILVVDDEPDTRELIAFVLEQQGAQVAAAASAYEALLVLSQAKPDILLSDIGMPEMDGYMLIQQVRALTPEQGGQTPAIALTAYAGETNQQQVITAGFQKHISKPIEPEELVQAIIALLRSTPSPK